jgi:hypothetical protein
VSALQKPAAARHFSEEIDMVVRVAPVTVSKRMCGPVCSMHTAATDIRPAAEA